MPPDVTDQTAAYVYLLGDYEENGTRNAVATLKRARLPELLAQYHAEARAEAPGHFPPPRVTALEEYLARLAECETADGAGLANLLARDDADLAEESPYDLSRGWGGLQLHVVRLT